MSSYDYMVKLIIIGDSAVGKSNVLLRFTQENFRTVHTTTIGVDFKVKIVKIGKQRLKMTIWDTAGQDRFKNITTTYYKGAHGVILMYSICDRKSFQNIQNWMKQVQLHSDKNVSKIIIGNKCDLPQSQRQVTLQQAHAFARRYGCPLFQTSAKDDINIQEAFTAIGQLVMKSLGEEDQCKGNTRLIGPSGKFKQLKTCEC